jgi:uncharacterized protein YcfJ
MKAKLLGLIAAAAMAGGLVSCEAYGPNTNAGAAIGGLSGAALGGIIGHQSGRALEGAAIGAAGGAVAGGLIGNAADQREREYYYYDAPPRRRGYYYQGY